MTVTLDFVAVTLGSSSAPLIEGTAPTTYQSAYNGVGFVSTSTTGRKACRVALASTTNFTTHPFVAFQLAWEEPYSLSGVTSVATGGYRVIFVDNAGAYSGFNLFGNDVPGYDSASQAEGFPSPYTGIGTGKQTAWHIALTRTPDISSGTLNWANIVAVEISVNLSGTTTPSLYIGYMCKHGGIAVVGTETFATCETTANASSYDKQLLVRSPYSLQSNSEVQYTAKQNVKIGDGSTTTNLTNSAFAFGFLNTYDTSPTFRSVGPIVQLGTGNARQFLVNQSASDTMSLTDGSFSSAKWWQWVLQGSGTATLTRIQFWRFNQFLAAHGTYASCTWNGASAPVEITAATVITSGSIINATTTGLKILGAAGTYVMSCSFANPSATADIELGSGGAGTYTLANISVASGYTLKIRNNSATNAITVAIPTGITCSTSTAGGSITITSPSVTRGLTFTGLLAGSQVVVYDTGTTTEQFRTNNSGTSETWSESVSGSRTVDYTIMLAGRLPIRVVGITVTGTLSGGVVSTPITQVLDRSYVASSGLTWTTNCTITAGTKIATWSVATSVQNFYSFAVEAWIAQTSLRNVAFPFTTNGPNSFTFGDGWEIRGFTTAGTAISNTSLALLKQDGLRYVSAAGVVNAIFAALYSVDTAAGLQVIYQQVNGSGTANALSTGPIDQLVQVFGTASYGNFDYRNFLVAKVQKDGFDQAESNVITTYGTLEDQLYVIGLNPISNGLATGAPTVAGSPTITDHGASPVTWNGKQFSITITDSGAGNTGTTLMRWIRYNLGLGGTFQGKTAFNWHDLVQTNGTAFKTVRGVIYGGTGAALKGVRVLTSGGAAHPDFNLHTADDGTTYSPPQQVTIAISGVVAGSRVQIYDTANGVELLNSTSTYTFTETYTVARTLRVRIAKQSGATAYNFIEANIGSIGVGAYSLTYLASQSLDTTYNTNAIDGSTVTGITITPSPARVAISIAGGAVTWPQIYAYQVYWLATATGIADEAAFIASPDTANYLLTGFDIKNTSTTPLTITGGYGRDAVTGLVKDCIDAAGSAGNIYPMPDHAIPYSSGSGLTAGQAAQLAAIPDATTTAAAVLSAATAAPIAANIKKVNGTTINGAGTAVSPWGP